MISVKAKLVSNTRAGRRERRWRQQCSYLLPYSFSWPGAQWPLWARLTMRRSLPRRSRKYVNCWWQRKPTASNLPCDGRFNPGQGTLSPIHFSSLDQWLPRLCRGYSLDPLSILPVPGEGRFIRAPPPSGRWPLGALDSSGSDSASRRPRKHRSVSLSGRRLGSLPIRTLPVPRQRRRVQRRRISLLTQGSRDGFPSWHASGRLPMMRQPR